jgi:hypothetical protein
MLFTIVLVCLSDTSDDTEQAGEANDGNAERGFRTRNDTEEANEARDGS